MINVSNEFRKLMQTRTDFKENAEITFADGTVLALSEKDFTISNNSVTDASETNGIPLGVALCRSIQIELMNDDDRFSTYDFFGAVIRLYLTFQLSETVEKIEYGTFTVLTPETYGETVIITALDDMYKADKAYSTSLVFPATIKAMLVDVCNVLDISLGTTSFLNDDFVVQSMPTDITYRQLIGYIAMIAGGNARIDTTGRLRIITYDFEKLAEIGNAIDGGKYNPWNNPTDLDGGSFNPWNVGDVADGGTFTDLSLYHNLGNWSNLKIDTDDVVITGVQTTYTDSDNEEHTVIYGTEGYVLSVENPLINGQEELAVGLIGNVMVGGRFRQFSGDLVANPTCEFMDTVLILDRKGNIYVSFLTDINFQFFGFTTISNSAEPTLRNSAKTYSQATQTLVAARKLIKNERTARETAVAQLAKDLANSSGLFMTQEKQSDGSIIYYMHDKPTLAESMIVWKLTALAFGISTDGGKTYPYGFTVNGEVITRLLYAEGINADYITSGTIDAEKIDVINLKAGNIKTGKITDKNGYATIDLDSGDVSITSSHFSWNSTYSSLTKNGKLTASDVDLTGKITASSGKIGGFTIGTTSIYNGKSSLSSTTSGVYVGTDGIGCGSKFKVNSSGEITASGGTIGGFTIGESSLSSNNQTSAGGIGVYIGNDAISIGNYFRVTNSGDIDIGYDGDINTKGSLNFQSSGHAKIKYNLEELMSFDQYGTTMAKDLTLDSVSDLELSGGDILMSASSVIRSNSSLTDVKISFDTNKVYVRADYSHLGKSGGRIGFFGTTTYNTKQTVSNITTTSSATASDVATKLNSLLTALRSYNLIG